MDVLLAGEAGLDHPGGSERFALEVLQGLGRSHRVRALVLGEAVRVDAWRELAPRVEIEHVEPAAAEPDGAWRRRRERGERMRAAVAGVLARDPADVVVGQLYTGAGAAAAAHEAGVAAVLLLAGYEALCHWAFAVDSQCIASSRCRRCPRALALPAPERAELLAVRDDQDAALQAATGLVSPSKAMAEACERITGRRPSVVAWVTQAPPPAPADPEGHVLLISSVWSREKGAELIEPIARRLPHRSIVVQAPNGLPDATERALEGLAHVSVRHAPAEIHELLAGASLVLVPSQLPEPFGRVAFEAMGAGVPVLASDTGGLAEFVPPGQLVRPHDEPDAWAGSARRFEPSDAWSAARETGLAAARAVLAGDPLGRVERVLEDAVRAQTGAPSRS
jgi:glycosyltransferase involved in cell wall biosynthesis